MIAEGGERGRLVEGERQERMMGGDGSLKATKKDRQGGWGRWKGGSEAGRDIHR